MSRIRRYFRECRYLQTLIGPQTPTRLVAAYYLLEKLRIRKAFRLTLSGEKVVVQTGSTDLEVARISLGSELEGLRSFVGPETEGLIIDAGGCIGTSAIKLSKMYPLSTVVSIEASSRNFALLAKNTAAHRNIKPHHAALMPAGSPVRVSVLNRGTGEWG